MELGRSFLGLFAGCQTIDEKFDAAMALGALTEVVGPD